MSDAVAASLAVLNQTIKNLATEVAGLKEVASVALDALDRLAPTEQGGTDDRPGIGSSSKDV